MKGLLLTFLAVLLLTTACSTEQNLPVTQPEELTELQSSTEEVEQEEAPTEDIQIEEENVDIDKKEEPVSSGNENAINTVNCDHDVLCFTDAVLQSQQAYYWGEVFSEPIPGVTFWTSENWTYTPNEDALYTLIIVSQNDDPPSFKSGWFEEYARSESAPAEIKSLVAELDAAEPPREEDWTQVDDELREAFEMQISSGKTAPELAWEQATYAQENFIFSSVLSVQSTTYTCSSTDKESLLKAISNLNGVTILEPGDLPFLECEKELSF